MGFTGLLDGDGNAAVVHLRHALLAALFDQGDDIAHILFGKIAVLGDHGKQGIHCALRLGDRLRLPSDLDLGAAADDVDAEMFFYDFHVLIRVAKQGQHVLNPFDLQYLFDESSLQIVWFLFFIFSR